MQHTMPDGTTPSPDNKVGFIRPKRVPSKHDETIRSTGSKIFEQFDEKYIDFKDLEPLGKVQASSSHLKNKLFPSFKKNTDWAKQVDA